MYDYAIIGNCQINALVSSTASVDWLCFPRPDSAPIFSRLLDVHGGSFSISAEGGYKSSQRYHPNTNVLETVFADASGNSFMVTDFAPRFEQYGRTYRPCQLFRIIKPISGMPRLRVNCQVTNGWSKKVVAPCRGNSHLHYLGMTDELRLTTNMPLSYLLDSQPIVLTRPIYFALTWGLPIESDLEEVSEKFLSKTISHWQTWVKHCAIPSEYQVETIRSALVLKLHCYEETGAILASVTTSLPEEIGGSRNWDYRFCWLRDACFTVSAFYRLGHFEELEGLLTFITNLLHSGNSSSLSPVFRIDGTTALPEIKVEGWSGFRGSSPVRVGNEAALQIQNDVYGEMILILAPLFFDERFAHLRSDVFSSTLTVLAQQAFKSLGEPDAGLWEHRDGWKIHSFTLLACWAGLDRYLKLLERGKLRGDVLAARQWLTAAHRAIFAAQTENYIGNGPCDPSPDASLLLLPTLRFPDPDLCRITVDRIAHLLGFKGGSPSIHGYPTFLYRYSRDDGFGLPKHPFVLCTFWLIEALTRLGKIEAAREILQNSLSCANHVGLFSEHFDPSCNQQTGNFPQCYSHVGLINAAFATSASWGEIL